MELKEVTAEDSNEEIIKDVPSEQTLIFTYGTLKRGFTNYHLIENLIPTNDAAYHGTFATVDILPLVIGPYGIPYLLNLPGSGSHRVHGELYSVTRKGLEILDELEAVSFGHYERLPIRLIRRESLKTVVEVEAEAEAEAYFAHWSYAEAMWEKQERRA